MQEKFAEKFPEKPIPHRNAVRRLSEKFRETGRVLDAERPGRPSRLNDEKLMDISDSMLLSPSKLLLKLAQEEIIGLAAAHKAVYRDRLRTFNELKTAVTVNIRNVSQVDLQKVFVNKIKRVEACMDARGHHFQHLS